MRRAAPRMTSRSASSFCSIGLLNVVRTESSTSTALTMTT
jgi:hypothetical protein